MRSAKSARPGPEQRVGAVGRLFAGSHDPLTPGVGSTYTRAVTPRDHPLRVSCFCAFLSLLSCDAGAEEKPPVQKPATAAAPTPARVAPVCTLPEAPERLPEPARLVAIGDLHGDLSAARAALRAAGAIDESDRWVGGDLTVVQTGDVLDRGDDEQAILDLFARLESEARAAGGAFIPLLGNHELMNAAGDFRYVTPRALVDFDDTPGLDTSRYREAPGPLQKRLAALGPGGTYARRLGAHNVIAIVGDTVFSHAGVPSAWAKRVSAANRAARCWLDGQMGSVRDAPEVLADDHSPVWTRAYGGPSVDCAELKSALSALGVKRMVVGHTVQAGGINGVCDGALWRIDVGMSRAYGGPIEVLELRKGKEPSVLKGAR